MSPSPGSTGIRPTWTAGQSWKVEFLRTVPSAVKGPVVALPPPQRSVWIYEVQKPASDRDPPTVIAIREEGGDRRYEMTFDAKDLSLRSVAEIAGAARETVDVVTPHQPYTGWSQSQPCIFDWPLFLKDGSPARVPFLTGSGDPAQQEATEAEGGSVEVVLKSTDAEYSETTRSRQWWTPGGPWWTRASVEVEYVEGEERETVVEIRGNRLP